MKVRVWSIKQNNCLGVIRLQFPIISLSFHKSGDYIAAASGSTLEIWKWKITCDYDNVVQGRNKTSVTPPMVMSSNVVEGNGVGGAFAPATRNTRQYMLRPITHGRNIRAVLFHPNGDYLLIAAPEAPRLASDKLTYCSLFAVKLTTLFHASTQNDGPPPPIDLSSYPSILPQIHLYSDGGIDISRDGKYLITCARLQSPPLWLSSQNVTSLSASAFSPMSTTDGMDAYMSQSNVFRQLSTHPMSLNWEGRTGIQDSPPRPPPISWTGGWTTEMDMSQSDSLGSSLFNVGRTTNSANRPLHRMVSMEQGNTQESSLPSSQPFGGWSMELSQSDSLPPPSSNSSMEWKPLTSQLPNFSSTFPNIVSQESINGQSLIPSTQSSMSQSMPKKHGLSYGYLDTLDSSSSVNKKTAMDMDEHLEEEYLNPSYLWTNPAWKNQLNTIQSHCYPYGTTNEPAFKACTAVISNVSNDNNSGINIQLIYLLICTSVNNFIFF